MSIRRLSLRDFVIVDALDLDLQRGFTAITGETGAGKSILIDAIQLLLGARSDALVVREGSSRCELGGEFDAPQSALQWLQDQGMDSQDDSVLLRRQIDLQGRSRAWINGRSATLTQLRELGEHLIDIHGQHDWHGLTRSATQLALVDAYGRIDTAALQSAWRHWQAASAALSTAQAQQADWQDQRERLQWQIDAVDKLSPGQHEWESLNAQHTRASHAQALIEAAQTSAEALDGEHGASGALHSAINGLQANSKWEPRFADWLALLQQAQTLIADTAHELAAYARRAEIDGDEIQRLDDRVALWLALSKRFRCAPQELAGLYCDWQSRMQQLDEQADLAALSQRADAAQQAWQALAQTISSARQSAASALSQAVSALMQDLGLAGGRLEIAITPATAHALGADQASFLVAAHSGASVRPVAKVASGGELSRIALAISVCTSSLGSVDALIFDEVDVGIGGQVAHTVGRLMRRLGQDRQVLAITHLAQVAACAHQHCKVEKFAVDGRSLSRMQALQAQQRVEEIARMLGGSADSPSVMAHAREILGT